MSHHANNDVPCSSATAAVRAGIDRDTAYGAVTPPIVLSSNFSFDGFGNKRQYDYTPVSYTHLDVYKRQGPRRTAAPG